MLFVLKVGVCGIEGAQLNAVELTMNDFVRNFLSVFGKIYHGIFLCIYKGSLLALRLSLLSSISKLQILF